MPSSKFTLIPSCLIAIGGLSGTGKSTLGRAIANHIGQSSKLVLLRSDVERKALFAVAPTTPLDVTAYAQDVTRRVYLQLASKAQATCGAGGIVIVDAVFSRPDERDLIAQAASNCGIKFYGLWLDAPISDLHSRVATRRNDASDATAATVNRQSAYDLGTIDWHRIPAGGTTTATFENAMAVLPL